jgi:hypothetical protein
MIYIFFSTPMYINICLYEGDNDKRGKGEEKREDEKEEKSVMSVSAVPGTWY